MSKQNESDGGMENRAGEATELLLALTEFAKEGFTEIVLHNPETGEEKTLQIPKI